MLIKTADDKSEAIALCEQLALSADPATRKHIETDLRNLRAGIKGDNPDTQDLNPAITMLLDARKSRLFLRWI